MKQTWVQENNIAIADLMGYYYQAGSFYPKKGGKGGWFKNARYDSDWNSIMWVIQYIEMLENGRWKFTIDPWSITCIDYSEELEKEIFVLEFDFEDKPIIRYYLAAAEFARWYKQNITVLPW